MRTTLPEAKTELFDLLDGTAGVTKFYDHEPAPGQMAGPVALTIATAGMTPDFWVVAVRIYVSLRTDARAAQTTLDALMPAVEDRLTGPYGPSNWTVDVTEDEEAVVGTLLLEVGREDG